MSNFLPRWQPAPVKAADRPEGGGEFEIVLPLGTTPAIVEEPAQNARRAA